MGRHDRVSLSSPDVLEAFERFVAAENQALAVLEGGVRRDEAMLRQVRG